MAEIIFGFISCGFRGQRQNYSLIYLIFTECLLHARGPILWKLAYKQIIIMLYNTQKIYSDRIKEVLKEIKRKCI